MKEFDIKEKKITIALAAVFAVLLIAVCIVLVRRFTGNSGDNNASGGNGLATPADGISAALATAGVSDIAGAAADDGIDASGRSDGEYVYNVVNNSSDWKTDEKNAAVYSYDDFTGSGSSDSPDLSASTGSDSSGSSASAGSSSSDSPDSSSAALTGSSDTSLSENNSAELYTAAGLSKSGNETSPDASGYAADTSTGSLILLPTPTPVPAKGVSKINLYVNYPADGVRRLIEDTYAYSADGTTIGVFECFASNTSEIKTDENYFVDLFLPYWEFFTDYEDCRIGYNINYTRTDGSKVSATILSPDDLNKLGGTLSVSLYDDVNQIRGQWYGALTSADMTDETLITSISVSKGGSFAEISGDISLTAFVYYDSSLCFDKKGNYIGIVSDTITLHAE